MPAQWGMPSPRSAASTPSSASQLVVPDGAVAGAFLVTVGDKDIRSLWDCRATPVSPGADITIVWR